MERHDSAKAARWAIERGMKSANQTEHFLMAGLANAVLAVAEELHRHAEIIVDREKMSYNKYITRQ